MRVVFSSEAVGELTAIGDYIAEDNPVRALDFVEKLEAAAIQLGNMPQAFPLLSGHEQRGIRRRPYRDYLIFYRIEDDRIASSMSCTA